MQAVVKTPHINIKIKGTIPHRILSVLQDEYGQRVKITPDNNEERINVFETEWYKSIKEKMTPGENLKIYRQNKKMTQTELGIKLGGVPKQHISNIENGTREISKNMAIKLAKEFDVSVEKFIG
jgi:DNA-binding XRE family transcriptional regulator